jgi:hypothetical protein
LGRLIEFRSVILIWHFQSASIRMLSKTKA